MNELVTPRRVGEHAYRIVVPDGWQQGRGAYGGLVVATLIRALELDVGDPSRPLRSVTAEIPAPVLAAPTDLRVEVLRAGQGVTTAACRLEQSGEVLAHLVGVFGRARPSELDGLHLPPPSMPPWREIETVPVEPPLAPEFARHFEFRITGPFPLSGSAEPCAEGWIRPKLPGPDRGPAFVAACIDAWYPALFARMEVPRPMATIAFTLQLVHGLDGLDPDAPLRFRSRDLVVKDGYFVELRELWGEDGRLVALNQQTFAIIK